MSRSLTKKHQRDCGCVVVDGVGYTYMCVKHEAEFNAIHNQALDENAKRQEDLDPAYKRFKKYLLTPS